jgi:hypothetical protein
MDKLALEVLKDTAKRYPTRNCIIIRESSTSTTTPSFPAHNIQFYLDSMVNLGIIRAPSDPFDDPFYNLPDGRPIDWEYVRYHWSKDDVPAVFKDLTSFLGFDAAESLDLLKVVFWFFRKGVVDNLIADIMPREADCLALSAGSINLTSDYDVNVYGLGSELVSTMFQKEFKDLFGNTSDIVFDTNLYSSSFMDMLPPKRYIDLYVNAGCGTYTFWYLRVPPNQMDIKNDQHVWSALKVVNAILHLSREGNPSAISLYNLLTEKQDSQFEKLANLSERLSAMPEKPDDLVFQLNRSLLDARSYVNHLSLVNYKGSETYYTRGAFLDVVVNQQMCQEGQSLDIDEHAYLDSMIENMADYCRHHGKVKYMKRIGVALGHIPMLANFLPDVSIKTILRASTVGIREENLLPVAWSVCEYFLNETSIATIARYAHSFHRQVMPSMYELV